VSLNPLHLDVRSVTIACVWQHSETFLTDGN
jgi:hypothetical protein